MRCVDGITRDDEVNVEHKTFWVLIDVAVYALYFMFGCYIYKIVW